MRGYQLGTLTSLLSHQRLCRNVILRRSPQDLVFVSDAKCEILRRRSERHLRAFADCATASPRQPLNREEVSKFSFPDLLQQFPKNLRHPHTSKNTVSSLPWSLMSKWYTGFPSSSLRAAIRVARRALFLIEFKTGSLSLARSSLK
jgi:hypothetical protein